LGKFEFGAVAFACLVLGTVAAPVLRADPNPIDQKNDAPNPPIDSFNLQGVQPAGQTFKPALTSVQDVQLYTADGIPGNATGASMSVTIYTTNLDGTPLATSKQTILADGFKGITEFTFAAPIPLTAGNTYAIGVNITLASDGWYVYDTSNTYANGTEIKSDTADPDSDLWFREGPLPEPSSLLVAGLGGFGLCFRRRRRA